MWNSNRILKKLFDSLSIIHILLLALAHAKNNSDDLGAYKCAKWLKKHASMTRDFDYFNLSRSIKFTFNTFDELNVNCSSLASLNSSISTLTLTPTSKNKLLLGYDTDLRSLLTSFLFVAQYRVTFTNFKGFNLNASKHRINNEILFIIYGDMSFNFYLNETTMVTKENCVKNNFQRRSIFGSLSYIATLTLYSQKICPYVFLSSSIKYIHFGKLSHSLIFENQLEFMQVNDSRLCCGFE